MTSLEAPDPLLRFLEASTSDRFRMALDPAVAPVIEAHLGSRAFTEYVALARESGAGDHLGGIRPNLVFVPGIMGTYLRSGGLGGIWWVTVQSRDHIDDLRLAADGTGDAHADYRVAPVEVDESYEGFLAAVNLRDDFNHVTFPYDWRRSLAHSAAALRDTILETYTGNGGQPVHLVAHSMGGLMIRTALMHHGDQLWPRVGRIVFIATPHYGAPAVASYLKNHLWGFDLFALLGRYLSRATFRSLWGAMELLPAPRGVYPGTRPGQAGPWSRSSPTLGYLHPCANFDLHDVRAYQLGLSRGEATNLQRLLDGSADFHRRLHAWHSSLDQERRDQMCVIAGVGIKTLFRLAYRTGISRGWHWSQMEKVTDRKPGNPHREGDGRVPLASAQLESIGATRYVRGVHRKLPQQRNVYEDVFRWLNGQRMELPDSPAAALSSHLADEDDISSIPHLDGSALTTRDAEGEEDPGWLSTADPDPAQLDRLEQELANGDHPEFITLKLL